MYLHRSELAYLHVTAADFVVWYLSADKLVFCSLLVFLLSFCWLCTTYLNSPFTLWCVTNQVVLVVKQHYVLLVTVISCICCQWCNQDFFFKTKTLISRPRLQNSFKTKTKPSVQDQDQDFASQGQNQDLFVMYTRGRPKSIFHFRP